jgi:transcriptional regulator of arginine metabolism
MLGTNPRHESLLSIIATGAFSAQEDVVAKMVTSGFDVTQSSISRDFRHLGISKIGGFYRVAQGRPDQIRLSHFIQSISTAGPNMLVVKTESGGASPVAEAVDHAVLRGIVGTVAGDNTIFIATENSEVHEPIKQFLGNI